MKITIDREADAAYIYFLSENEKTHFPLRTMTVDKNVNIDYAKNGKIFGIEILSLSLLDLDNLGEFNVSGLI